MPRKSHLSLPSFPFIQSTFSSHLTFLKVSTRRSPAPSLDQIRLKTCNSSTLSQYVRYLFNCSGGAGRNTSKAVTIQRKEGIGTLTGTVTLEREGYITHRQFSVHSQVSTLWAWPTASNKLEISSHLIPAHLHRIAPASRAPPLLSSTLPSSCSVAVGVKAKKNEIRLECPPSQPRKRTPSRDNPGRPGYQPSPTPVFGAHCCSSPSKTLTGAVRHAVTLSRICTSSRAALPGRREEHGRTEQTQQAERLASRPRPYLDHSSPPQPRASFYLALLSERLCYEYRQRTNNYRLLIPSQPTHAQTFPTPFLSFFSSCIVSYSAHSTPVSVSRIYFVNPRIQPPGLQRVYQFLTDTSPLGSYTYSIHVKLVVSRESETEIKSFLGFPSTAATR